MLDSDSNLKDIRLFLKEKIGAVQSLHETESLVKIIFDHAGLNYLDSFSYPERPADPKIISQIKEIVEEIANHTPIQYILGYTSFYGLKLYVNSKVLIPRPETEELVDRIIKSTRMEHPAILDIGTGSGCIAIALKKNLPDSMVYAIDNSPDALELAGKNAGMNGCDIKFKQMDFLEDRINSLHTNIDLIVSNPPYVTHSEKELMEPNVLENEPWNALFVEDSNPLVFYRAIAEFAKDSLNKPGDIWLEINEKYGEEIKQMFLDNGYSACRMYKDMQGKNRIIHVKSA